jgi:hypothetical protein
MSDDAWWAYLARVSAAQEAMRAVTGPARARFDEETAGARGRRDAVVKPAEAGYERERQGAWEEYKARMAAEECSQTLDNV